MADLNEAITSNEKTHQTFSELGLFNVMLERIGPNLPGTRGLDGVEDMVAGGTYTRPA